VNAAAPHRIPEGGVLAAEGILFPESGGARGHPEVLEETLLHLLELE